MVVMRPDWAGGSSVNPTAPKPRVNRMPSYRQPTRQVAASAPPPVNRLPAMRPTQYSTYVPPAPAYSPPATNFGTAQLMPNYPYGQPTGGTASAAASTAVADTKPEPPPMTDDQWLAGDTEYQNEIKGYDDTLKDFLARITTQETDFNTDYKTAVRGFGRNRDRSMLNLGEDFTSRGLANSGMFAKERTDRQAQFKEQETGMTTARNRGLADFKNQRSDKQRSTDTQKGNARRASLARMAQEQAF